MVERKQVKKRGRTADGFSYQNARRAARASRAVAKIQAETGLIEADGIDTAATDLICDLMHLCDRAGLEFEYILRRARTHHDAEVQDAEDRSMVRCRR